MSRRLALACLAALLQACGQTPVRELPDRATPPATIPGAQETYSSPAITPEAGQPPQAPQQPPRTALAKPSATPLDASRLPPFEGERRVLKDPLRGVPKVDLTVTPDDVWVRIRAGFAMPNIDGALVREKMAFYVARPEYLQRMFDRSRPYLYHIVEELEKRNLPTEIALLPMVESAFNPMAYSRAHASGLWQFIPGTGRRFELQQNWWYDGRRDIIDSTSAALDYLTAIYEMHGDWHLALASYNWGENAVARAIAKNRAAGRPADYMSLTMPAETRHYIPKLQALKNIIANPGPLGISLDPIPNQPYFATYTKLRDIDVQLAAKLAEMKVEDFIALNPGFSRPVIRASLTPRIVLPADKIEVFHDNLSKLDPKSLVSWTTYHPKKGDTLESIARRHHMSVAQLKEVNGIGARQRGTPKLLVVPVNAGAGSAMRRLPIMYAPPIPVVTRKLVHTVKAGETLTSIGNRYGVSIEDIRRWNASVPKAVPGLKLNLEVRSAAKPKPRSKAKPKPRKKS
ncbi:MAG: transglycosylase SLT domain-containing protein [Betaproteobacteria bacterium]